MPRKARVEGAAAEPSESDVLAEILNDFRENFPDKWEEIARCPTQHGIDIMIETLNR